MPSIFGYRIFGDFMSLLVLLYFLPLLKSSETEEFDSSNTLGENSNIILSDEQRLVLDRFQLYDPTTRPVYNASRSVTVKFNFALIQICDVDERNEILTLNLWFDQEWHDENLRWNSSDYSNLEKIRLPCTRVWIPDIVLYNSADDYLRGFMKSNTIITSHGDVFWSPPTKLHSRCKIDVSFFPFDDQLCTLKFGSWTYSGLQVDIISKAPEVDLTNYMQNGEWEIISISTERVVDFYACCPQEPYPSLKYTIHLRRRVLYYILNIIVPCVWLSVLSVTGFLLPSGSGEKVSLGITVLLAYSVFMLSIAENIPQTSEHVPIVVIYLTFTMGISSLSIILTVWILNMHHTKEFNSDVPIRFYNFITKTIAGLIGYTDRVNDFEISYSVTELKFKEISNLRRQACNCSKNYYTLNNKQDKLLGSIKLLELNLTKLTENTVKLEHCRRLNRWKLVAYIVDRFFFWLALLIIIIFTSLLLLVVPFMRYQ